MSLVTQPGHSGGAATAGAGTTDSLIIPARFSGPPGCGNGGYVCGRIATYADGPVTVTLRQPVPLATPLSVERGGDRSVRVLHERTLIAETTSSPGGPALDLPGPVSSAEAHAVAGSARYYADPVFPDCFVCGTGRPTGDGLRVFPGPLAGRPMWAAPWTPDPSVTGASGTVRPEVIWAALDCPSGFAAAEGAGLGPDTAVVLGRMTATVGVLPVAGDDCVVASWPGERDGRKLLAGSALVGPRGDVLAAASAVWIIVPRPAVALAAEGAS
jgi:hypothetical protein